jgi:hypothetical protein
VADTPVAPPEPDAVVAEETRQAADPDAQSPDIAEEAQESTAPDETATEIVTEAEEPAASQAPASSMRPKTRPERVAEAAQEAPQTPQQETQRPAAETPAPAQEPASDPVADAIAEALSGANAGGAPSNAPDGPPMTQGERDAFKLAVNACWIVDVGSQAADVKVVVGFDMQPDGTVVSSSLRLLSSEGGSGIAVETAYEAARRAILRCQIQNGGSYDLPEDKYEQWKRVEMTFNPEDMRLR